MDGIDKEPARPELKKVFGWIPFGKMPTTPLLRLNFKIAGALIDANAFLRKPGWQNATELNLASNVDGFSDEKEAEEERVEDSRWLRYESGDYAFALALGGTMVGSKTDKFRLAAGKELYKMHKDLSRQRLCWARWVWGWRRNPGTGEYRAINPKENWYAGRLGVDEAIVDPPDTLEASVRYQTKNYSLPSRRRGKNERMLAVYAAIAESASPADAAHAAAQYRLLAPFAKAVYGFDPEGLEWLKGTNCPETFMELALLAHRRGFVEAGDALLWCALKDLGSPLDIPLGQEWHAIDKLSTAAGNRDFHLMWTNEILRNRVLRFPQDFGETLAQMRGIVRRSCLDWLGESVAIGDKGAIGVFLELIGNAKRLPLVPHCQTLGDDEFDALARLGRRLHERANGERFGAAYREALENASAPSSKVWARLRDLSLFDAFVKGAERDLPTYFPNLPPKRNSRLPEESPWEGMSHEDLWRWLGRDATGDLLFTEESAAQLFASHQPMQQYVAPKGKRMRAFDPMGSEVEVFGIDTRRTSLGVTFIRTWNTLEGEVVRAFPQIPLAPAVACASWARLKSWIPWTDESCAYAVVSPLIGGWINAVFTTFVCDWNYPDASSLYKTTLGVFADSMEECGGMRQDTPVSPQLDAKLAWHEDVGIVVGDTTTFPFGELGVTAAVTPVEFARFPDVVPVYHRCGLRFAGGMRIRVQGWIMADAEVDHPARDVYAVFGKGEN